MLPEYRKVEALLAMGRTEEAAALAAALPPREKPSLEFLKLRGRAMRAAGRVFDAEASFREALAMAPSDPGLLADLATTLLGQGRLKEALPFARDAASARPEVAAYHALVGFCADRLDLTDEASRALRLARELAPQDAEAHTVYGYHALRHGKIDDAEGAFRDALGADPRRSEALRGLARVALARGDYARAREAWLDTLRLDPRTQDSRLTPVLWLGHPWMAPVRAVQKVPILLSVTVAVTGAGLLWLGPHTILSQAGAIALFGLASVGPAARRIIVGGLGE